MGNHMMGYPPPMGGPPMPPMGQRPPNLMPPTNMQQTPGVISRGPRMANEASGPTVTVFVGNITDRAPDNMIRQILQHCGPVLSWKRVQGASGVLQGKFLFSFIHEKWQ